MHPTLLECLAAFSKVCETKKPTYIYKRLVMLKCSPIPQVDVPGIPHYCDCLSHITTETTTIEHLKKDITLAPSWVGWWRPFDPTDRSAALERYIAAKHAFISTCMQHVEIYVSMHENHAIFNKKVWVSLIYYGRLAEVRAVCLRDLRNQKDPERQLFTGKKKPIRPIATPSYGEQLLKTFLVNKPKGWF